MSKGFFCSYDRQYRDPFGAVTPGTAIHFRVRTPRDWGVSAVALRLFGDSLCTREDALFWAGMDGDDHEWWECHWAPETVGLYFYDFLMTTAQGPCTLACGADGWAVPLGGESGGRWQITCYAADFATPDWLAGGVMYQIFPDRYAASGRPKTGVPADRRLHTSWQEAPEWRADEQGRIRNNDFFGGDLAGITEHLDDLAALGVTCLYLNPIFEAASNHRYDTADYETIDPLLGEERDLWELCARAAERGIRVLLDGVFSHTGADSRYFNRENRYAEPGAYQTLSSPYASWYTFRRWPDDYAGWWGFDTLPEVQETQPDYLAYITGKTGIVRRWLQAGIAGWRLDVADELPDEFLDALRVAVKEESPQALVLGEVWEDASNKCSYGHRRRYLLGQQLDSVMNYPFRDAILHFLCGGSSADFYAAVWSVAEHYPPPVLRLLMNHIGTHDTERALTVLAGEPANGRGRSWQAEQRLSPEQRQRGLSLLRLAAVLQYCLPGVPCVYYGDEVGMEGYRDPFNRSPYPWGQEDAALRQWYVDLGRMRHQAAALREGEFVAWSSPAGCVVFERQSPNGRLLCAVNRESTAVNLPLPADWQTVPVALGSGTCQGTELVLPPLGCAILLENCG